MTIEDIRKKLNEDWGKYNIPIILKILLDFEIVYVIYTYQGLFWYSTQHKSVRYISGGRLYSYYDIQKIFTTKDKDIIDKILNGSFVEKDERYLCEVNMTEFDCSIENLIPSENEETTQDLMNKYSLV